MVTSGPQDGLPSRGAPLARVETGRRTVTLFGSGEPSAEGARLAEEVGRRIALRGWVLRNGGYGGTMEAAARGARSAGGTVEGVTCRAFERPAPNAYLNREIGSEDLFGRLAGLVSGADAFGAFPGGTGTLTEVFLTWELMAKRLLPPRPLCLIGREWESWWQIFEQQAALRARLDLLSRADGADAAIAAFDAAGPVLADARGIDLRGERL